MTSVNAEGILQLTQTFSGVFITWINDPTISLHEDSRAQVFIGVPPVRRARSRATSTQYALIQTIQFRTIFYGLQVLGFTLLFNSFISERNLNKNQYKYFSFWDFILKHILALQPGLYGSILFIEVVHIRHQIAYNIHMRQRIHFQRFRSVGIDFATNEWENKFILNSMNEFLSYVFIGFWW